MKYIKYYLVNLLLAASGCNLFNSVSPNQNKVKSTIICSSPSLRFVCEDSAIVDLYIIFLNDKDLKKSNYEAYSQTESIGLNWNPQQKLLFAGFGSDLCGSWNTVYKNVDEEKIKSFINQKISISSGKGRSYNLSLFFEEEKDVEKALDLKIKYFLTNSCKGKG